MSFKIASAVKLAAVATVLAAAGAAVPGVATPAEAKKIVIVKKHFHGHHFHHRHRHFGHGLVLVGGGYGSCYWMKARALETGSPYWWKRYHICRGDY